MPVLVYGGIEILYGEQGSQFGGAHLLPGRRGRRPAVSTPIGWRSRGGRWRGASR
jgi:hypothetical protein